MKKNDTPKNIVDISDIFTDAWYEKVLAAVDVAVSLNGNPSLSNDVLTRYIIDYNISRLLQDKILNMLIEGLPTHLDWTNIDTASAFNELKMIIDNCDICPVFKEHVIKIKIGKHNVIENNFAIWKKLFRDNLPNIKLSIKKNKAFFTFTITRV